MKILVIIFALSCIFGLPIILLASIISKHVALMVLLISGAVVSLGKEICE